MTVSRTDPLHPGVLMNTSSILLVDDFEDGLEMYQEYLTYRGYRVLLARNGEEAIVQARVHRPDVILLDIRMPGMTGTDAMRVLRSDPSFRRIPIVALTAHALDGERVAALAAGFDELIPKPCLPDQLALAVERILATTGTPHATTAVHGTRAARRRKRSTAERGSLETTCRREQ
jgi:CheY-like chemotaxis protein